MGSKKRSFLTWTPKNWGYFNNVQKCKFLKMRTKRVKIYNLYVKFHTKVEKRGSFWVWTEEKRGVNGCKIGFRKGLLTGT